ncbi:carbohydrate binding domain-containing protein [Ruegeria atlantica]|uniref:carbohydrate binding domain-containing protein n=1 Tax=Ruegeria atlantica TaxID=81569 RepID=UPI002495A47B|nr:carbohydrate binding domain-containing protein [Ruegeria atlantica]
MISLGLSITSLAARSRHGTASLNLVANGSFEAETTGWAPFSSTTLAIEAGRLRVIAGAAAIRVSQDVSALVQGQQYRLTADIDASASNGTVTARINNTVSTTGSLVVLSVEAGQSGTFEANFTARAEDDVLLFNNTRGLGDYWLDNIKIEPV